MSTVPYRYTADEICSHGEYLKKESGYIGDVQSKIDPYTENWTIASAEYSVPKSEHSNNTRVKEEFVDLSKKENENVLDEFIDCADERFKQEFFALSEEVTVKKELKEEFIDCSEEEEDSENEFVNLSERKSQNEGDNKETQTDVNVISFDTLKQKTKELKKLQITNEHAENYDVSAKAVHHNQKRKDKILSYVQNSKEKGEDGKFNRIALPSTKVAKLPLSKKVAILKDFKNGVISTRLAKKYGASLGTIQNKKNVKDKILSHLQGSSEKREECSLKRTAPKRVKLPLSKKVEVLKEHEKGESVSRPAKMYGYSASNLSWIKKNKDKLLNYVRNSIEKGETRNLNRTAFMPPKRVSVRRSKGVNLPLSTKVDILEKLTEGEIGAQLAQKYDVSTSTIYYLKKKKNEIRNYVHDSIENGQGCNLKRTALPASKRVQLSLDKKIEILEELEKGKSVARLAKKYGYSVSSVNRIKHNKDKILSFCRNSIEKGEGENVKRTTLPYCKRRVGLTLENKVEILEEIERGQSTTRLAEKYGTSVSTIVRIERRKEGILNYIYKSIEKGQTENLKMTRLPTNTLSLSKKKMLHDFENGEHCLSSPTVYELQKNKDKILSYVQNSIENKVNLQCTAIPPSKKPKASQKKRVKLALSTKLDILEKFKQGNTVEKLAQKYNVCTSVIYYLIKRKNEIRNYVKKSIENGQRCNLKRTALPASKRVRLSLSKKIEILEKLEKGESISKLAQKSGYSVSTVNRIKSNKKALLTSQSVGSPMCKKFNILKDLQNGESVPQLVKKYGIGLSTIYKMLCKFNRKKEGNLKRAALPPSKKLETP